VALLAEFALQTEDRCELLDVRHVVEEVFIAFGRQDVGEQVMRGQSESAVTDRYRHGCRHSTAALTPDLGVVECSDLITSVAAKSFQ
jgi:hypothetical protein